MGKDKKRPGTVPEQSSKEKLDQWEREFELKLADIALKKKDMLLRILIPMITVVIGLWQFFFQQQANEKLKFKADLWSRQHQMYLDVADAIGQINAAIASHSADSTIKKKMISFKIPYWKSTLVEDPAVTKKLIDYNISIDLFINTDTVKQKANKAIRLDLLKDIPEAGEEVIKTMSNSLEEESLEKWHNK